MDYINGESIPDWTMTSRNANTAERINMIEGISKDTLLSINPWDYDNQQDLLNAILELCTELDPWLPIENAPKDKSILLLWPELGVMEGYWICDSWYCDMWELTGSLMSRQPTHYKLQNYKLLPMPPTEQPDN